MKDFIEIIIFNIVTKFLNIYWRQWKKKQKSLFASCGKNVEIGILSSFSNKNIYLGNNVFIGSNANFMATLSKIIIGNNVMFGPNVTLIGGDHRYDILGKYMYEVKENEKSPKNDKNIIIEDDVWIGANVTILKGVKIGNGSIIGAGSIIVKDVLPNTIHVGCPKIKELHRFDEAKYQEHIKILNEREKDV